MAKIEVFQTLNEAPLPLVAGAGMTGFQIGRNCALWYKNGS